MPLSFLEVWIEKNKIFKRDYFGLEKRVSDVSFGAQFIGTISVVVFVFVVSFIVFQIIKNTIGLRISKEAERLGTDKAEVGVIAYGIRD